MVPYRPGEHQVLQDCKDRDLVLGLAGLHQEETEYLPGKNILKILSGTTNLGKLLQKGSKKRLKKRFKKR